MLNIYSFGSLSLGSSDRRLQCFEILISNFDFLDFLFDFKSSIDKVKYIFGEVVRIFDKESGVDESSIVEIFDEFSTILIRLLLNR